MNPQDLEIILKPIKQELVAFEERVLKLENKPETNYYFLITELGNRVKALEEARLRQMELNKTLFSRPESRSNEVKTQNEGLLVHWLKTLLK